MRPFQKTCVIADANGPIVARGQACGVGLSSMHHYIREEGSDAPDHCRADQS